MPEAFRDLPSSIRALASRLEGFIELGALCKRVMSIRSFCSLPTECIHSREGNGNYHNI